MRDWLSLRPKQLWIRFQPDYMAEPVNWLSPAHDLRLKGDEVHLWKVRLDMTAHNTGEFLGLLNQEEQNRAKQFIFEKERNRFTTARGILRCLLAGYLGCSAKDLEFSLGPSGKPALRDNFSLRFNLTHSNGLILYAFSLGRELGIDVEEQLKESTNPEIVARYFSTNEQAEFFALPPTAQEEAFYSGWTRKEAYLKARGDGLQATLKNFDVSLNPEQPLTLRSEDSDRWGMHSFCPEPGFVAALVVEGGNCKLCFWKW